jgi:hypothetical protein
MSLVAKYFIGSALIIAGVMTGQAWLVSSGTAMLLSMAAEALGPKAPRAPPLSGIDVAYSGTLEPRRMIYGLLKVSGMHAVPPMTSGNNNDYFHQILVLSGRSLVALDDLYVV